MDSITLVQLVGILAISLAATMDIPQIIKMLTTKDVSGISLIMLIMKTVMIGIWLGYGALIDDKFLMIANSVCFIDGLWMLFLWNKYKIKKVE